ncbi:LysE family translocator [Morganella morganii]|uniref:LysE family translocator n=1 Tax=Morganella morganii TaxID=582 RepID=UPI001C45E921|nr:LysE family translocator [Morganella morganii]QXO45190.1 LysE family translocator [Morganella morganii]QXO52560.1 LysE family translocator [Morganella morganii]QXO56475.1 LysE family translocator [Morganella morganii]QXO60305.1 LysE family translocator [Morganella morganii]QXO67830.1 LysE family translocator [Morganella morganii]
MALSIFVAFWAVSILFVITPGADWAYAISAGIQGNRIVPAVTGMLGGHLLATLIVAAGVGALITEVPGMLSILTIVGAGYLIWLGIGMLRHPSSLVTNDNEKDDVSWMKWVIKGFCISGLNPKVFLLFLALLPQFTDIKSSWPLSLQMTALGLIHVLSCGVVYLIVGYGSRAVLQARPRSAQIVNRISGALMIIIAVILLAESFI